MIESSSNCETEELLELDDILNELGFDDELDLDERAAETFLVQFDSIDFIEANTAGNTAVIGPLLRLARAFARALLKRRKEMKEIAKAAKKAVKAAAKTADEASKAAAKKVLEEAGTKAAIKEAAKKGIDLTTDAAKKAAVKAVASEARKKALLKGIKALGTAELATAGLEKIIGNLTAGTQELTDKQKDAIQAVLTASKTKGVFKEGEAAKKIKAIINGK